MEYSTRADLHVKTAVGVLVASKRASDTARDKVSKEAFYVSSLIASFILTQAQLAVQEFVRDHPPPPGIRYGGCGLITDSPPPGVDSTHSTYKFECEENMYSAINKSGNSTPSADDSTPSADNPTPPGDDSAPPADDSTPPADPTPPWWVVVGAWCADKLKIDALLQYIYTEHLNPDNSTLSVPE